MSSTIRLTATQKAAMAAVLQGLGLKQKALADLSGVRQSALSDFLKQGVAAGMAETAWEEILRRLQFTLETRAAELRAEGVFELVRSNLDILVKPEQLSAKRSLQPPGAPLSLEAASYIERGLDAACVTSVRNEVPIFAIFGGPRTGKTSLLWRIQEFAERNQRGVAVISLKEALREKRELTAASVFRTVFSEIAPEDFEWREGSSVEEVLQDARPLLRKLKSAVGRAPPLLLLDDVDALIDAIGRAEGLSRVYSQLYELTRAGVMHVYLTSEGHLPHLAYVSSLFNTAESITLRSFGPSQINQMAGAYSVGPERLSEAVRDDIRHATGGNPELVHLVFDYAHREGIEIEEALQELMRCATLSERPDMGSTLAKRAYHQRQALNDWLVREVRLERFGVKHDDDGAEELIQATLEQIVKRQAVGANEAMRLNLKLSGYVELSGTIEGEFYRECARHLLSERASA